MTSFSFSNCTEELSFASFFYTQSENSNDVIPCNKYEQITPSYLLSVNQYGLFLKHYGMGEPLCPPLVTLLFLKVEGQNLVALGILMCFLQKWH